MKKFQILSGDVVYALRMLRKNPVFAVTATVALALGIGGSTAIFTVVRAVLLKPLAYRDPDRLVMVTGGATDMRYEEIRGAARSYSEVGAYLDSFEENVTLSGAAGPEVVKEARVSANFLHILGVEPMLGRSFSPEEEILSAPPVAMISAELWQRRFGADPSICGRTATLAGTPYTIIGALPAGFPFPFSGVDVWVTKPAEHITPLSPALSVFGRLKSDVDIEQATAELAVLNKQYASAHPGMLDSKSGSRERVTHLKEHLVADVRSMLWMLFGAVSFVLLIACANVASLLLARASYRAPEFAVRAALGASRGRLIAQQLVESVVLAVVGGVLGILFARWSLSAIIAMTALDLPRAGEIQLDGMVLAFALVLSFATGILFGLAPSLGASRPNLANTLKASGEGATLAGAKLGTLGLNTRGALVVGQVALSMVLLIGATLLIETLDHLRHIKPGFEPANLLTMRIALSPTRYDTDQKKAAFFDELVQHVESLPGVRGAAVALTLPLTGFARTPVQRADQSPLKLNERPLGIIQLITPDYFRTLKIPLRRGRGFTARDIAGATAVVVINESLAQRLWPAYPNGLNPVGQRILIGASPQPVEIVGIVADMHQSLEIDPGPGMFQPSAQKPPTSAMLAVRTQSDPLRSVNPVRHEVATVDHDQAISDVKTMENLVEEELGQRSLILLLLALFAGAAMVLALVGIYGVIAHTVVERTKEVGIRRALGAQPSDILRLVLGQGLGLALTGVIIGLCGAFALTRVMESLLYHVRATDPATFAGIALMFILVAMAASYIPARRAMRIDPMAALR
jgi:predicted permease